MPPILLLGPQRHSPTLAAGLESLGVTGPVATVTAGWQERESETAALEEHLAGRWPVVHLRLHERAERVFAADRELFAGLRAAQDRLKELQRLYRVHLTPALAAARRMLAEEHGDPEALAAHREMALDAVRRLDADHLERCARVRREAEEGLRPADREVVAAERAEIAEALAGCEVLAVAGGHVAVLLNRLRLFGVLDVWGERPVVAWSAGAMTLARRVVLFHDSPPWGAGDAEVLEHGLGRADGVLPLPWAGRRLRLTDPRRVALFARRFAPLDCLTLQQGAWLLVEEGRLVAAERSLRLRESGEVTPAGGGAAGAGASRRATAAGGPAAPPPPAAATDGAGFARPLPPPPLPDERTRAPLAVRELLARTPLDSAAVDEFLARHPVPIVEGTTATFLYRGAADRVELEHWIYGLPSRQRFRRVAGTDLWLLVLEIPERSRVEYKLRVVDGHHRRTIRDPLNPRRAHDPFGANSVLQGAGYEEPDWTQPDDPPARPGSFVEMSVASTTFDEERPVRVYLPARFRPGRRYPLLVLHDGEDYARYAALGTVLDNLIDRLEIAPLVVALTQSPDRLKEYGADPDHARFVAEELVPLLERELPLEPGPAGRGLGGASFGAVASLSTAWRYPGRFGCLLLQSGSFAFTDIGRGRREEVFDPVVRFMNRFREDPRRPSDRLYVSCGIYESLIYENRSLLPLLQEAGLTVRYREARDGHNWENWRDRLREGLSWLFPGPLWMVYE